MPPLKGRDFKVPDLHALIRADSAELSVRDPIFPGKMVTHVGTGYPDSPCVTKDAWNVDIMVVMAMGHADHLKILVVLHSGPASTEKPPENRVEGQSAPIRFEDERRPPVVGEIYVLFQLNSPVFLKCLKIMKKITLVQKRFEKVIEKMSSSWEIVVAPTAAKSQNKRRTETHGTLCEPV